MAAPDVSERKRIAIVDGGTQWELSLPRELTLGGVVATLQVAGQHEHVAMMDRGGRIVAPTSTIGDLADGAVLTIVDARRPVMPRSRRRSRIVGGARSTPAAPWVLMGMTGALLAMLALFAHNSIEQSVWLIVAVASGVGSIIASVVWAIRARGESPLSAAPAFGPLILAFAAVVSAIPPLPVGTQVVAVFSGTLAAAVLAGGLRVIAPAHVVRAELGLVTVILLAVSAVWALALSVGAPPAAAAAVTLGASVVALRALPSLLIDVSPGTFIDYARFQISRWTVRQTFPETVDTIVTSEANGLIARSTARLVIGTALLSALIALSAPIVFADLNAANPGVFAGKLALACCAVMAPLLGARKSSAASLRWMPRAAVAVVFACAASAFLASAQTDVYVIFAGVTLVLAAGAALSVVPVARGASSLFWSRTGDTLEWLAIVLVLPAALLAADVIGIMRSMAAS